MTNAAPHVLVDPHVFALPAHPNAENMQRYLCHLVAWGMAMTREPDCWSVSEDAVFRLYDDDRYPTAEAIKALIRQFAIDEYTFKDVSNAISVVISRRPYLEDRIHVRAIGIDGTAQLVPSSFVVRLGDILGLAWTRSVFMASLGLQERWSVSELRIGTCDTAEDDKSIQARGVIELIERVSGDLEEVVIPIDVDFVLRTKAGEEEAEVSWKDLYSDPPRATRYAYVHEMTDAERSSLTMGTVVAGASFVASLEGCGLHNQPAILKRVFRLSADAACDALTGIAGAKLHPVRTSDAGDAPQVERSDKAKLWRCMVTKTGAGYPIARTPVPAERGAAWAATLLGCPQPHQGIMFPGAPIQSGRPSG